MEEAPFCSWGRDHRLVQYSFLHALPVVEPRQSLQQQQGHVILLLPSLTGKALQFAKQEVDERWRIGMHFERLLQAREAEHFTAGAMRLHQAIAVEKQALSKREGSFLLLVARPRQQPKRHTRRPQS